MAYNDVREFIEVLEKNGDLVRVRQEVDWNLEAGAITRKACEESGPAVLLESLKDYPQGYRVLGSPIATFRRMAAVLDMPADSTYAELLDRYDEGLKRRIKPKIVNDAPCKEEIHIGDAVDLYKFPALLMHGGDGGRYLCTWHVTATKDLESDWVNWGMYRAMIQDKKTLGGLIYPFQHIGRIHAKYIKAGKPMPFAMALNPEPVTAFIGASNAPYGVDEMDVIGGMRSEALSVIKCETNDLLVPASAEIVIEGVVSPDEQMDEGPFGEFSGYQSGGREPRPVYHVKAITHRKDPILGISNTGMPVDDSGIAFSISSAADIRADLINAGVPITGVCVPPECCYFLAVVSTRTPYAGIAARIANIVWACKAGSTLAKVIVVDESVDPTNMADVFHAFSTAHHPIRGTHAIEGTQGFSLQPFLSPHEKLHGIGANVFYDCTFPKDWGKDEVPVKQSFRNAYPKEIQDKVLKNWKAFGFK